MLPSAALDQLVRGIRSARQSRAEEFSALEECADLARAEAQKLRQCCEAASEQLPMWGGAASFKELPILQRAFRADALPQAAWALIAVDGSQIFPNRHKSYLYAYARAQCQAIVYNAHSEQHHALMRALNAAECSAERVFTEAELLDPSTGELQTQRVALERSLLELEALTRACALAHAHGLRSIALLDGMLLPFALVNARLEGENAAAFARLLSALEQLRQSGAVVCGYVDRPNSRALVQTIALGGLDPDEPNFGERVAQRLNRVQGMLDRYFLESVLPPAHYTLPFIPAWRINRALERQGHAVSVCYANFGHPETVGMPSTIIARLELPAWCADESSLHTVCAVLDRQVQLAGGYPMLLAMAHKAAAITRAVERSVDQELHARLTELGLMPELPSFKQQLKEPEA